MVYKEKAACQRALLRAVDACGSVPALADRLHISPDRIEKMLSGSEPIAVDTFMRIVDVVVEADVRSLRGRDDADHSNNH